MRQTWWMVGLLPWGCSSGSIASDNAGSADYMSTPGDADTDADADADSDTDYEQEEDLLRFPPAQTDRYVFVPNPDRDTVTRIEVDDLSVLTFPVGDEPILAMSTPDLQTAIVFNRGDDTLTVIEAESLQMDVVAIRPDMNALSMSLDGQWVVAWHDRARERPDDPVGGVQSFAEASFLHVSDRAHQGLGVGFDPRQVLFTPDNRRVLIVSDAQLAVIDLAEESLEPQVIELQPGVLTPSEAEEVVVSPDGATAWVRLRGSSDLRLVDLATFTVSLVPVGVEPTDLDTAPSGDVTVAVSRGDKLLYVFDARDATIPPRTVPLPADANYGSLVFDPTGATGVLFTNAALEERYALWDKATDAVVERPLVKPVQSVHVSPDGRTLLVVHTEAAGSFTNPAFQNGSAVTLIDLATFRTNPILLPRPPLAIVDAPSGDYAYIILDGQNLFLELDYRSLLYREVRIPSVPIFIGVMPIGASQGGPEPLVWINQDYSLGRMSFFDPAVGDIRTVTGFELNSEIEVEE